MPNLNIISHISSGFSLVAFIVATAGIAFRAYLATGNAKVPPAIRVRLAEIWANRFNIDARNLTKNQQLILAVKELNYRTYKLTLSASLVLVVTVLLTIIAIYVLPTPVESSDCVAYRATQAQGSNDGKSLVTMGGYYENGRCVHQNQKIALSYYLSAANHLEPQGYLLAGALYENGIDKDPPDFKKAMEYYQDAIDKGDPGGGYLLIGQLYDLGQGVKQDGIKALDYYKKAADHDNPRGLTLVGADYVDGSRGVARNCKLGMEYLNKAYKLQEPRAATLIGAQYCIGTCVEVNHLVARKYLHEGDDWGDKPRASILLDSKECQVQ